MWAMVDAHLHDAVREHASVRAIRDQLAAQVRAGQVSAVEGTARILEAFSADPQR
jgi:LAO/AO transport system kinase